MVGEIINKNNKFEVNVPELPRKQFKTQKEAEDFISSKTDFATNTKYHSYQLPGGEPGSYRELLLTLPQKNKMPSFEEWSKANGYGDKISQWPDQEFAQRYRDKVTNATDIGTFKSSHWDEPNVLAHARVNDREIPEDAINYINEEKELGGRKTTKYHSYQLPGGEPGSYRELLLTLPQKNKMPSFEEWSKANGYGDHPGSRNLYEKIKSGEVSDTTGNANQFQILTLG